MINTKKKPAFTLAEVMVVLLVLTILFAAFAPFITKRKKNHSIAQDMWNWSSRNYMAGPMNAYFKPISNSYLGGIYIGTTPDSESDIKESYTPLSKLVIRSGYVSDNTIQNQLQLRYGRNSLEDPGQLAATFLADNTNLLFGSYFYMLDKKHNISSYPANNIGFGYHTFNTITDENKSFQIRNNVAFGSSTLKNIGGSTRENTAIGANAGENTASGILNTYIGYMAGQNSSASSNTYIGAYSSPTPATGAFNTFVGAKTGYSATNGSYSYNVALGYNAMNSINNGNYNVAIGANALPNLTTGKYNVAIGYNSCFGITGESYITCIGANSGPVLTSDGTPPLNSPVKKELGLKSADNNQRTYIGTNPHYDKEQNSWATNQYPGDATLEIHNIKGIPNAGLLNNPQIKSNVTTVINGNLIVRGKTYLTMGNALYPFYYENNIFGTKLADKCANNQKTYIFNNTNKCAELSLITSDRRLKNILSKNTDGLDKIKQIKVYNYTFKNDKDKKPHVGVIAQELQKIFPNSVSKDENGYLKIRWDEMFYAAINAIKELNSKITSLINRTDKIETKITELENENKKLKEQINSLARRVNKLKNK